MLSFINGQLPYPRFFIVGNVPEMKVIFVDNPIQLGGTETVFPRLRSGLKGAEIYSRILSRLSHMHSK
jgi:hypothetical protein